MAKPVNTAVVVLAPAMRLAHLLELFLHEDRSTCSTEELELFAPLDHQNDLCPAALLPNDGTDVAVAPVK